MSEINIEQMLSDEAAGSAEMAAAPAQSTSGEVAEAESARKAAPARKKASKSAAPVRATTGGISWAQVGTIFDFVRRIEDADEEARSLISSIFQATQIELAQAVTSAERLGGYRLAASLAHKSISNSLTARDGMRLAGEFAELDAEILRFVAHSVSIITGVTVRYRKDRNSFEVALEVLTALENIESREDIAKQLTWVDETLMVWPGA